MGENTETTAIPPSNIREVSATTRDKEKVTVEIIEDMGSLPIQKQEEYAEVLERISGPDIITKEGALSQFQSPIPRVLLVLKDSQLLILLETQK